MLPKSAFNRLERPLRLCSTSRARGGTETAIAKIIWPEYLEWSFTKLTNKFLRNHKKTLSIVFLIIRKEESLRNFFPFSRNTPATGALRSPSRCWKKSRGFPPTPTHRLRGRDNHRTSALASSCRAAGWSPRRTGRWSAGTPRTQASSSTARRA